jgi:hypothetical protein
MRTRVLAEASFTISGDEVNPDFWTHYFDVSPEISIFKGDPINDPTGQGRTLKRRTGVWAFSSGIAVHDDRLEPHLRFLVAQLGLPRADLRRQIEKQRASVRFFCFWVNETGNRIPDIPHDIRKLIESLGGMVDIDEYR